MASQPKLFVLRNRTPDRNAEERRQLLAGLAQTKLLIDQAYAAFNGASDSDLIESYVFEINALQSRYSYLLRRVRELDEQSLLPAVSEL